MFANSKKNLFSFGKCDYYFGRLQSHLHHAIRLLEHVDSYLLSVGGERNRDIQQIVRYMLFAI